MEMRKLILASNSPRRKELLALFGFPFTTSPSNTNEVKLALETPEQYVIRMAYEKGRCKRLAPDEFALSADTIVELDGEVIGKPTDEADAILILNKLRGKTHLVHTALSLHNGETDEIMRDICHTKVSMRNYSDEEIQTYLNQNNYLDKAGAYAIQDADFHPVEGIEGCYSNVMGLPLCNLYRLLQRAGFGLDIKIAERCQGYNDIKCEVYPQILMS
ncbi:MAG: septum formation protein Maf [Anaerolineaceae bacterium]|nr:septum formation protein Maf [Anaerolineaceae bacterium]